MAQVYHIYRYWIMVLVKVDIRFLFYHENL